jgi:hypothetical protein
VGGVAPVRPNLPSVLPQVCSLSVHSKSRDQLLSGGAVPFVVRALAAPGCPAAARLHAVRCLLNFAWAGPEAVVGVGTFHVILQSKHGVQILVMTASIWSM